MSDCSGLQYFGLTENLHAEDVSVSGSDMGIHREGRTKAKKARHRGKHRRHEAIARIDKQKENKVNLDDMYTRHDAKHDEPHGDFSANSFLCYHKWHFHNSHGLGL